MPDRRTIDDRFRQLEAQLDRLERKVSTFQDEYRQNEAVHRLVQQHLTELRKDRWTRRERWFAAMGAACLLLDTLVGILAFAMRHA